MLPEVLEGNKFQMNVVFECLRHHSKIIFFLKVQHFPHDVFVGTYPPDAHE